MSRASFSYRIRLLQDLLGEGGVYQIGVRHPAVQFAGFFQNVF